MIARAVQRRDRRRFDLSRPTDRTAGLALLAAALLALLIWSPGGRGPGDPAAVSGDARLARCAGETADVEYAFGIPRAADYRRYLPAMPSTTELDVDRPALVVVYRSTFSLGVATPDPATPADIRDLCVYVGEAGGGTLNYFSDVSIAGLRATPDGPTLVPVT